MDAIDTIGDELTGTIRCIYIDPPYNNRESYTHYDDTLNHGEWLDMMEDTLEALIPLLTDEGSLWVSIDDTGMHYLKVLIDELMGPESFITTIVWEHRTTRENRRAFSNNHEYLLVYAPNPDRFKASRNRVSASEDIRDRYKNPDDDPRGPWQSISLNVQAGHGTKGQFYELVAPNGRRHRPPKGRCWIYTRDRMEEAIRSGQVWFGRDGNGVPRLKRFLSEANLEMTPSTLWTASFAGTTSLAKREILALLPDEAVFDTPKPEKLLQRVIEISTDPGDLVLDAFLGSATTAAVAHKMHRRWVGIENGVHAITHCAKRMKQVMDGEAGGISRDVGWTGGGDFNVKRVSLNRATAV